MANKSNLLDVIPSVRAIEQRLRDVNEEARKLRVLLATAKKIERDNKRPTGCEVSP